MSLSTNGPLSAARWRTGVVIALLVPLIGLSACGGDDSGAGTSAGSAGATGSDTRQDRAQVRLTECLREQGIDLPDDAGPGGGGGGPPPGDLDQERLQEALEGECREFQQEAFGDVSEEDQSEFQDRLTRFTSCMRANGVEIPDAEPGSGPPPQIDQDDPAVQRAAEACQDEIPGGPGGPGGSDQ